MIPTAPSISARAARTTATRETPSGAGEANLRACSVYSVRPYCTTLDEAGSFPPVIRRFPLPAPSRATAPSIRRCAPAGRDAGRAVRLGIGRGLLHADTERTRPLCPVFAAPRKADRPARSG